MAYVDIWCQQNFLILPQISQNLFYQLRVLLCRGDVIVLVQGRRMRICTHNNTFSTRKWQIIEECQGGFSFGTTVPHKSRQVISVCNLVSAACSMFNACLLVWNDLQYINLAVYIVLTRYQHPKLFLMNSASTEAILLLPFLLIVSKVISRFG